MNFSVDEYKVNIPEQKSSKYETAPESLGRWKLDALALLSLNFLNAKVKTDLLRPWGWEKTKNYSYKKHDKEHKHMGISTTCSVSHRTYVNVTKSSFLSARNSVFNDVVIFS